MVSQLKCSSTVGCTLVQYIRFQRSEKRDYKLFKLSFLPCQMVRLILKMWKVFLHKKTKWFSKKCWQFESEHSAFRYKLWHNSKSYFAILGFFLLNIQTESLNLCKIWNFSDGILSSRYHCWWLFFLWDRDGGNSQEFYPFQKQFETQVLKSIN